jgi:hypothetical protein
MELTEILLSVVCIILILVLMQLLSLKSELGWIRSYVEAFAQHADTVHEVRTELLDELREVRQNQSEVKFDISEIKYVTDVIYKYKLPNKDKQALLDQVEIDNEVFGRLGEIISKKSE